MLPLEVAHMFCSGFFAKTSKLAAIPDTSSPVNSNLHLLLPPPFKSFGGWCHENFLGIVYICANRTSQEFVYALCIHQHRLFYSETIMRLRNSHRTYLTVERPRIQHLPHMIGR
jgi:hypothetical protein